MDEQDRRIVVVDAPSNLGLAPPRPGAEPGCRGLASTLRNRGIVGRIGAEDGGRVAPPPYSPDVDATGIRSGEALRTYSMALAKRIESFVCAGSFPLVLGGDCGILVGNVLALRRIGRFGLAFLDGHLDFRHPGNAELVGAAAGADLALVTGRGSNRIADIEGLRPLVRDGDVVALGEREDYPEWRDIHETEIAVWDLGELRALGPARAALKFVGRMEARGVDGFWIHLDADVLDDAIMPAVDYRLAGGLGWDELSTALRALMASGQAVGINIGIFNPRLDEDGTIARRFVESLVAGLQTSEPQT
jgi:arginase